MKKRLFSVLLCLCTMVSILSTTALAAGFTDVKSDAYYAKPVDWAVAQSITTGKTATTFAPNETCTRAQIITFLWRAAGSPEPRAYKSSPYFDVADTAYYCKSAAWAAETGITDIEGVYFNPNTPCTRAAAVEYIWHYAKSPKAAAVSFTDVKVGTHTANAVSWAVGYGVTNGKTSTTFAPGETCTRGQIVTFLHRYFVEPLATTPTPAPAPAPADTVKLDPLPPAEYTKHAEWYVNLTPVGEMNNAKLVAESDSIAAVIADYKARGAFITDSILVRKDDIMYQIMERSRPINNYDYYASRGWVIPSYVQEEYDWAVAKWGDPEPLRRK